MRDALANLEKLPPQCYALIDDKVVSIRRGARRPEPVDIIPKDQVEQLNRRNGVSWSQMRAMIVGVTMGWDADAADPDTHSEVFEEQPGPREYQFVATLTMEMGGVAYSEQDAIDKANAEIEFFLKDLDHEVRLESLDLVEG